MQPDWWQPIVDLVCDTKFVRTNLAKIAQKVQKSVFLGVPRKHPKLGSACTGAHGGQK